jgi:hypothetical protein
VVHGIQWRPSSGAPWPGDLRQKLNSISSSPRENLKNLDDHQLTLSPTLQMNSQQDPQVMALNNAIMA